MKLTSMFMSLLVLSMTVEGLFFDCPCRGTCFSSPISNYILTFATGNYTEAIGRCSGKMFHFPNEFPILIFVISESCILLFLLQQISQSLFLNKLQFLFMVILLF